MATPIPAIDKIMKSQNDYDSTLKLKSDLSDLEDLFHYFTERLDEVTASSSAKNTRNLSEETLNQIELLRNSIMSIQQLLDMVTHQDFNTHIEAILSLYD